MVIRCPSRQGRGRRLEVLTQVRPNGCTRDNGIRTLKKIYLQLTAVSEKPARRENSSGIVIFFYQTLYRNHKMASLLLETFIQHIFALCRSPATPTISMRTQCRRSRGFRRQREFSCRPNQTEVFPLYKI